MNKFYLSISIFFIKILYKFSKGNKKESYRKIIEYYKFFKLIDVITSLEVEMYSDEECRKFVLVLDVSSKKINDMEKEIDKLKSRRNNENK